MKITKIGLFFIFTFGNFSLLNTSFTSSDAFDGIEKESSWGISFNISSAIAYTQSECDYNNKCNPGQEPFEHIPVGGGGGIGYEPPPIEIPGPPVGGEDPPENEGGGDGGGESDPISGMRAKCLADSESTYQDCEFEAGAAGLASAALCVRFILPYKIARCEAATGIAWLDAKRSCSNDKSFQDALCAYVPE